MKHTFVIKRLEKHPEKWSYKTFERFVEMYSESIYDAEQFNSYPEAEEKIKTLGIGIFSIEKVFIIES